MTEKQRSAIQFIKERSEKMKEGEGMGKEFKLKRFQNVAARTECRR